MPLTATAAFESTEREMELRPATSTTEGTMVTSEQPTYGETSPLAMVVTITFGKPTGSACIAGVIKAVPPEPPSPMIPSKEPLVTYSHRARDMAPTASPRSAKSSTLPAPSGWKAATASRLTVASGLVATP